MIMLDTNVIDEFVKLPASALASRVRKHERDVSISVIVAGEIEFGLAKNPKAKIAARVRLALETIDIVPLPVSVAPIYGRLHARSRREGLNIGANDLLIASHAIALDATLVSGDRDFRHIDGLKLENWREPVGE